MPTEVLDSCTNGFLYCFSHWTSDVTTGMFWVFALFAFSFIIFLATLRFGTPRAFGFGSFVGMIGAVWLATLTLIPWWVASAFIIVGMIGIAAMIISQGD